MSLTRLFTSSTRLTRTMSTASSSAIRPSASLIVAAPTTRPKQGDSNYRLLMMKRNAKSSFTSAHVFPGGVVDKHDDSALWGSLVKEGNSSEDDLTHRICAIREAFEESGLLLTDPPASTVLADDETEMWRQRVHADASQFKTLCEKYKLRPAVNQLKHFANWITPTHEKKRFNTHFFLTVLDNAVDHEQRQEITADGKETVQLDWFTPKEALTRWNHHDIVLFPPQWYCLHLAEPILQHQHLGQVGLGSLRTREGEVVTILPQRTPVDPESPEGQKGYHSFLAYPGDAVYKDPATGQCNSRPDQRHRLYIRGKMEHFHLVKNTDDIKAHL